ncbi:MAG: histidine phosphatase family protein [Microcystis aeruginosa Ma_QC_Ch_20071001_S25]|jgi:alpha-ribazole phosphatase|uniref:Histidine phosphatase family protein n=3 Tax=Microcystis aeruginosa TaxID=1126 RepID=A0A552FH85_MICAE|nr:MULTISPECIES: histidine phosphatase family protein [unclassified Microcystis]MCA2763936.1 histidine phosphatase family protein [Microcystis sp. M151S2]MCU7242581.1 histidine phosphatase family protein [Microcystis aeruginosa WS75]MDJ0544386.1 histidine phosphatase family protein [Microcystis sp. M53601_WE4]NCQ70167.1 histidine phosphatase family protein [Microcystis aeruginosa W13-16]NCQ74704.1 histidine phosphatase family protein [Microcystis aeruginosa W13-13]NCQ79173.1 histidine phospha
MCLMLYFLRHGQTAYSKTGGYCGTPENDPGLTAEGIEMAEEFADVYRSLPWRAAYVSPLQRAIQTAKPLCEAVGLKLEIRQGLQEIGYGLWEGMHPNDIDRQYHDLYVRWLTDPAWNAPPNGERGIDIARRSAAVLEEIEHTHSDGNILIVSHKATIRIMLCSLMGIDVGRYRDRFEMPVAAVSIVELGSRGPLFHGISLRSHLSEYLRSLPCT